MNRRSFMKGLAGVVAGVSALSKAEGLRPSAGIDPNSEWAKQCEVAKLPYSKLCRSRDALEVGQAVAMVGFDGKGVLWVEPIKHKDFYKT